MLIPQPRLWKVFLKGTIMEKIVLFKTSDKKLFNNEQSALRHENKLEGDKLTDAIVVWHREYLQSGIDHTTDLKMLTEFYKTFIYQNG